MALKSIQYNQHTFDISYEIVNKDEKVDLIILHGWGSSKSLMKKIFSPYMKGFRHIYIDLPGFGNSTCSMPLTTSDVARIVELLMIHINAQKDIIIGHSFGGKVATMLDPKELVLLSSAGIVVSKSFDVRLKIATFKMLKFFGLSRFRSKFIADDAKELNEYMYQTFKNVVDEDFNSIFSSFDNRALIFWGRDDTATPLSSGNKIAQSIKNSTLKVYDGDHFFFINYAKDISKIIEDDFLKILGKN